MKSFRIILFFGLSALGFAQDPVINAVQNAASNIPAGLPNGGVARGALFVIYGTGMGPATFAVADKFPFQTSIGGTSVQVNVGGSTAPALMYYAGATQVAAILPSGTAPGTGNVTVTFNGRTSAPAPITVVQNSLGIFTVSQTGAGDAIATIGNSFATPTNAANPGEIVAFWGTGLGPVTFDESNAAQQSDMTGIPVEAYVAGKAATVAFRGRNGCCAAVDTVYIRIPDGVAGCATPVVFKIGNIVSNTTTVPVAASGRTCTPTNPGVSQTDLAGFLAKGTFTGGGISLNRSTTVTQPIVAGPVTIPGSTSRSDSGGASFFKVNLLPGALGLSSAFDIASFGSCTVTSYSGQGGPPRGFTYQSLDAGASIGVAGPNGLKTLTKFSFGGITGYSATFDETNTYLTGGNYVITGPGGADVGTFSTSFTLPTPLTWTNQSSITTVDRARGVTVNWTGGDPAGYVQISGFSFNGTGGATVNTSFTCTAKTSDGTFTVPPIVLLALPPSGTQVAGTATFSIPGFLSVAGVSAIANFKATGIDYGAATSSVTSSSSVTYQ